MKSPPLVPPEHVQRLLQAAAEAESRRDVEQCVELLERAGRLLPSHAGIPLQLGRIHGLRYDYPAAERCFEQALQLAQRKVRMLTAIGDASLNFRRTEIAERYLRRALAEADVTPEVCVKLAELYERTRRLPEAEQLIEQALQLAPGHPAALLVRARLERLAGRLESAEQVLRSFIAKPVPDVWIHAQSWYELGSLLDRQKRYDEAMAAFLEAKALLRPAAAGFNDQLKGVHANLKVMASKLSAEPLRHWFENGPALMPHHRLALLCGYARSGTTLIEQVLDAHPDIVSAEETEVFVDEALAPLKRRLPPEAQILAVLEAAGVPALQQARAAYFRAMELSIGSPIAGRLLLDKNPMLTFLVPAFVRIFPETRFLIALRDPRDVVLSRFLQALPPSPLSANFLTLEGTIEDYAAVMSVWRTLAPLLPAPHLEVRYEDMVEDLESVARKTLDFLGVTWDARVLGFDEHARQKMVRSPTYADVTQPVYKRARGRWQHYQKYLEPHLEKLEPFVKAFGYE
ncbi:MAG TPA: sulfotransferase [Verrucomicrobiae bacterium]|nr:sulfotransferase [Verrucomicrobiae bacterium]